MGGWWIVGIAGSSVSVMVAGIWGFYGIDELGIRLSIIATARSSCLLFLLPFISSALTGIYSNQLTRFIRENRRYFGLSFAASHLWHAIAIIGLAIVTPSHYLEISIGGLLGYLFLTLMVVTSWDTTASWLGEYRWRILHTVGAYYLWIAFIVAFGKRLQYGGIYYLFVGLLVGSMILKIFAWYRSEKVKTSE
ncbi:MAG: hypothetical protein LH613_09830 [Chamaesiphon sp.]|nr:hypothetical protein [Chamaesiphon sp.]